MLTKLLRFVVVAVLLVAVPNVASALTVTRQFVVSATVPAATGISITATRVAVQGNVFGSAVTAMDFNPLTFNAANGIWVPDHYFAVDVGATGGAGTPVVLVSYGSESSPAGQAKGLGFKSTATFVKVTGTGASQTETSLTTHGPTKLLNQLTAGEVINASEVTGGFFRMYVGVYTGGNATIDGLGGVPFTNADVPGTYQGTLIVAATIP